MDKQNKGYNGRCKYCSHQATGINYRAKSELTNALSCGEHATHLFVPFVDQHQGTSIIDQKSSQILEKSPNLKQKGVSREANQPSRLYFFFQQLMSDILEEFHSMKKQILENQQQLSNLKSDEQSKRFKMQGDQANTFMIIHQDEEMLRNAFAGRLIEKYHRRQQEAKIEKMAQRRRAFSSLFSKNGQQNEAQNRTIHKSPNRTINPFKSEHSTQHSPSVSVLGAKAFQNQTQKRQSKYRDFSKTQRVPKQQFNQ